jgi:hypothetical protein
VRCRRASASTIRTGASIRTRADFDAAASTAPSPPIWPPTAIALDRSLTASPLHRPACPASRPSACAIGRKASSATTLNRKIAAVATPCSSRRAPTAGASALTAEAPQIIVPPASRSDIGRRTPSRLPTAWAIRKVLGSAAAITPAISARSAPRISSVRTLSPIRMIASRSIHLPTWRSPAA